MNKALTLVWACFVLRASFYACAMPVWEGWDEYSHLAYIQALSLEGQIPVLSTPTGREIIEGIQHAPIPHPMRKHAPALDTLTFDRYWTLPPAERQAHVAAFASLHPQQPGEAPPATFIRLYEAQQASLFYLLTAPVYRALRNFPLADRVLWLRLLGVLIASASVPLTYRLALRAFGSSGFALGAASLLVALPGLMLTVSHVTNDTLAVTAGAALLLSAASGIWWVTGICLGIALLTKAYFLAAIPALVYLILREPAPMSDKLRRAAILGVGALAVAGWWYGRNLYISGTLSGVQSDVVLAPMSLGDRLRSIQDVRWGRAIDFIFWTYIWCGGWSFLQVRTWMYRVFAVVVGGALAGAALGLRRDSYPADRATMRTILVFLASMGLAMLYQITATFTMETILGVPGWYWYGWGAGEVVVLGCGWMLWLRAPARRFVFPVLCFLFAALELFAIHVYLLPYLSGLTFRRPEALPPALPLTQFDPGLLFSRLSLNKPEWLPPSVLLTLWVGFLVATFFLLALNFRGALRSREAVLK